MPSFTARSPAAQLTHGRLAPANAMLQKIVVSRVALQVVATIGARHQLPSRRRSNTLMSSNCAAMKALHEATAMRGVASQIDSSTASANPHQATWRAARGPKRRLTKLLTLGQGVKLRSSSAWVKYAGLARDLAGLLQLAHFAFQRFYPRPLVRRQPPDAVGITLGLTHQVTQRLRRTANFFPGNRFDRPSRADYFAGRFTPQCFAVPTMTSGKQRNSESSAPNFLKCSLQEINMGLCSSKPRVQAQLNIMRPRHRAD